MYPCIPHAPRKRALRLPAFLPRVRGDEPVLCPLMIKCAITFCLIVFSSGDLQTGNLELLSDYCGLQCTN